MENKLRMCVPCHFGLESVLAYEIKKIGGENLTTTDGKISFERQIFGSPQESVYLSSLAALEQKALNSFLTVL